MRFKTLDYPLKGEYNVKFHINQHVLIQHSTSFIPSDLRGENFIARSSKTLWYTKSALVVALDEML